jgi:hypothetical protein
MLPMGFSFAPLSRDCSGTRALPVQQTAQDSAQASKVTSKPQYSHQASFTTSEARSSETSTASASTSSTDEGPWTGELTWYATGAGACGQTNVTSDKVVAVSHKMFDLHSVGSNSNDNSLCGRKIMAWRGYCHRSANGKTDKAQTEQCESPRTADNTTDVRTIVLEVADRCTGCDVHDLDITEPNFEQLAPIEFGRVPITWEWMP